MTATHASRSATPLLNDALIPARAGFIAVVTLVAFAIQIALYWPTTGALPFGDDWGVPLSEIHRGNADGLLSFFTETRQPDSYRPVQSLLMWLFGRVDESQRWFSIRILHFICSGALLASLALMLHAWRVGRNGVVAALFLAALHPTLVAPVGSVDGFSSTLSCAFVWFGVWAMYVTRERPALSLALACAALVLGTLVKEYAFALTPTAVLTALFFFRSRWRSTLMTAAILAVLTISLLWVRQFAKPADLDIPDSDFAFVSPGLLVFNAGLVVVGGLLFGDSFALYLDRSPLVMAVSGVILLLAIVFLVGGWRKRMQVIDEPVAFPPTRFLLFLLLSFAAVTFPANLVMKISEMYLCGLVVSVALLFAFAADGWNLRRDLQALTACIILLALCTTSVFAIWHKMTGMIQMGELARVQADGLTTIVGDEPEAKRVKILYRQDQLQFRPTFSSYRLADCYLIRPTAAWVLFPERDLLIDCVPPLPDLEAVQNADRGDADIVLYWDVKAQRYERLK